MALATRLELRQGQSLVITPQLQQAIKLLQLSNLELEAFVEAELERNPLLEREDREPAEAEAQGDAPEASAGEAELSISEDGTAGAAQAELDAPGDDVYADAAPGDRATGDAGEGPAGPGLTDWSKAGKGGGFEGDDDLEGGLARDKTLPEHLHEQLAMSGLDAAERA